jgi:hypothetical protein
LSRGAACVALTGVTISIIAIGCGSRPPVGDEGTMFGPPSASVGPCTPELEGKTVACHVETGRDGSFVNCFHGLQVCENGKWSACGGPDGTLTAMSLETLRTKTATLRPLGSRSASGCAFNPCDPNCLGEDTDAGGLSPGSFTITGVLGTITTPEKFPGGPDGPKNSMGTGWNSSTKTWTCSNAGVGAPGTQAGHPPTNYKTCSSDYCCAATGTEANTCQPWVVEGGDNPKAASCPRPTGTDAAGVDFTVGLACQDTAGHVHVPVCNRGESDTVGGTLMVAEYSGNPQVAGSALVCNNPSDNNPKTFCKVNLATKPIAAGTCIDVDVNTAVAGTLPGVTCTELFSNGNRTMMVNPPGTTGYTQLAEGDVCNNYGFHPTTSQGGKCSAYGVQPPPPAMNSNDYEATCGAGEVVRWNQFAYSISPNTGAAGQDYDVAFTFTTGSGVTKTIHAKNLVDYPGVCAFSAATSPSCTATPPADSPCNTPGPTTKRCPTSLATLLGAGASDPNLTLSLTLTPGASASPVVSSWSLTYDCIANE